MCSFLENTVWEYFLLIVSSLISTVINFKFGFLCMRQFLLHLFHNLELNYVIFLLSWEVMEVFRAGFLSDGACTATGRPTAIHEHFAEAELEESCRG